MARSNEPVENGMEANEATTKNRTFDNSPIEAHPSFSSFRSSCTISFASEYRNGCRVQPIPRAVSGAA
jgi:hypothetical protein